MKLTCFQFKNTNRFVYIGGEKATESAPPEADKHKQYIQEARNAANNPKASAEVKAKLTQIEELDKSAEAKDKQEAESLAKELVKNHLMNAVKEKIAAAEKASTVSVAGIELGSPNQWSTVVAFLKDFGSKDLAAPIYREIMNKVEFPVNGGVARFDFGANELQIKPNSKKNVSKDKLTWGNRQYLATAKIESGKQAQA